MKRVMCAMKIVATATILWLFCNLAYAQTYPSKPITLITPYGPGGTADLIARLIADKLSKSVGQAVIVENRPGASGTIGTSHVAHARPDGYTLLVAFVPEVTIVPHLMPKLTYDPMKDLSPIILAASYPLVLVTNPKLPVSSLSDLIMLAKSSKQKLSYASSGSGSPAHLAFELLKERAGINMVHIPYKGGGPALMDVMGNHVPMFFSGLSPALPYIASKQLRAIAVSSSRRSPALPSVPTVEESGLRDFDITTWNGVFAPAGTPSRIIELLNAKLASILQTREVKELLAREGAEFSPNSPEEFRHFIQSEYQKYGRIIKQADIHID